MNIELLQVLVTNCHNRLRRTTQLASRHASLYDATILKVKQIQLQKNLKRKTLKKNDIKSIQNSFVYFYQGKIEIITQ